MGYSILKNGTLVAVERGKKIQLAFVSDYDLNVDRKPGIGRVTYRVHPAFVVGGRVVRRDCFALVRVAAKNTKLVSVEEAVGLVEIGAAQDWKAKGDYSTRERRI